MIHPSHDIIRMAPRGNVDDHPATVCLLCLECSEIDCQNPAALEAPCPA